MAVKVSRNGVIVPRPKTESTTFRDFKEAIQDTCLSLLAIEGAEEALVNAIHIVVVIKHIKHTYM